MCVSQSLSFSLIFISISISLPLALSLCVFLSLYLSLSSLSRYLSLCLSLSHYVCFSVSVFLSSLYIDIYLSASRSLTLYFSVSVFLSISPLHRLIAKWKIAIPIHRRSHKNHHLSFPQPHILSLLYLSNSLSLFLFISLPVSLFHPTIFFVLSLTAFLRTFTRSLNLP